MLNWLKKPKIISCKAKHELTCESQMASMSLLIIGWGRLYIKALEHPNWPGIRQSLHMGTNELDFMAPANAELEIRCFNLFGISYFSIRTPLINSLLRPITPPKIENFGSQKLILPKPLRIIPAFSKTLVLTHSGIKPWLYLHKPLITWIARTELFNVSTAFLLYKIRYENFKFNELLLKKPSFFAYQSHQKAPTNEHNRTL